MVRVDRVEPDLAYVRLLVELDRNETDDRTSHLGSVHFPGGLGHEQSNEKLPCLSSSRACASS
jgi:hypothetical protein